MRLTLTTLILLSFVFPAWCVLDSGYQPTNYVAPNLSMSDSNNSVMIQGNYRGAAVYSTIPFSSFVTQLAGLVPGATNAVGVPLGGNATFTNLTLINPLVLSSIAAPSNVPPGAVIVVTNGGALTWTTNAGGGVLSVTNYSVSIQSLVDSGTYVSLNTNVYTQFPFFSFALTNRMLLGTVPSFAGATITGFTEATNGGLTFPNNDVQFSTDGTNWLGSQNVSYIPVFVSLYDGNGLADTFSNVSVLSFASTNLLGTTNDFTGQITLVTQINDPRSVVTVQGANAIGASQSALWSAYPAVSSVNAAGNGIALNGIWSVTTPSNRIAINNFGMPLLMASPIAVTNAPPTISLISVTTNIVLEVNSQTPPSAQYATNLYNATWFALPSAVLTFSGGNYYITAPLVAGVTNIYFRAVSSGGASAATLSALCSFAVSGTLTASNSIVIATNAFALPPPALAGAGILWNSNNALYWVTSSHTNYLSGP